MLGAERILALDIGAATVKVGEFQVSKSRGPHLSNFNYADLGVDPEHEENRKALIVSTIRNVLREKSLHGAKVIFSVSGQSVFTRFVKLPPVDESKVVQIIQYEAQQNVPFPIDEVVWDYQLIGSNAQGELEVVLFAIKSNIIEDLNEAVELAGLRTEKVDVAPMALYNAVRYNYGDLDGCTIVLDIGARTTNLLFIEQSKLFSRSIPIAGNAITQSIAAEFNIPFLEAEQVKRSQGFVALGGAYEEPENETQARVSKIIRNVMTRLHAEVGRSVNFYRTQQDGGAPARVFLSGGSSILPYTDRFFHEKLSVPIEYFNPFRNVELDQRIPRDELVRCAHFFGEVVGLSLRQLADCPIEVNLLPASLRSRRRTERRRPYLAGVAAGLLMMPLFWWGYQAKTAAIHAEELNKVKTKNEELDLYLQKIKKEDAQIRELVGHAGSLVQLIDRRSYWPALLEDLSTRMVPNTWIVSFHPQRSSATPSAPASPRTRGRGMAPPTATMMPAPVPPGGMMPPPMFAGGMMPGGGRAAATTAQAKDGNALTEIQINGAGRHDFSNPGMDVQLVNRVAQHLRGSPFVDREGVEIVNPPPLMSTDPVFNFTLRVRLTKPITL
ncbi:type IV pilus assembly protein PilM [bacterium]|nr:type IV pilus assembly protein PilM [bacterium]